MITTVSRPVERLDGDADARSAGGSVHRSPLDGVCVARLDGPTDVAGFRRAARTLFAHRVRPEHVHWTLHESLDGGLFDAADADLSPLDAVPSGATPVSLTVPAAFIELTEWVALHRDTQRFALLYQLLWRLQHEPGLRHDALDAQWMQATRMAQAVRHDRHKMRAYVRFRPVPRATGEAPLHVAWFEPEHHVVEADAPFFARRFAAMHWAILTPLRSVFWDGKRLRLGAGARPDQAPPADAGEALWLTYYENIFNPARLNLSVMAREMPRRYWKNLPEATLIHPLSQQARQRVGHMIEQGPSETRRSIRLVAAGPAAVAAGVPALPPAGTPPDQRTAALQATRGAARGCTDCPLHAQATQTVFGEGPVDAQLMFVGEQPGDREDLQGRPFVGPAGQLFDAALSAIGVDRQRAFVTNAVKHFKFELRGKRRLHKTAAQHEAAACLHWLEREIALVSPLAIVALGATAARSLLGRPVAVLRERGQWHWRDDGRPVLVTLHPSALLRLPEAERDAAHSNWLSDLRLAAAPPAARRAR